MRFNPRWPAAALLLAACACAQAQTLNQCRGQGGATAYRGGPCLPGERLVAVAEAVPDPEPAPVVASREVAARASPARSTTRTRVSHRVATARPKRRRSSIDPCTKAKRARDDFQRRRGIRVTMDELSRWNHRVYDACK